MTSRDVKAMLEMGAITLAICVVALIAGGVIR